MIDLYTASTPNGWKASVALEELGLPYTVHPIDLSRGLPHLQRWKDAMKERPACRRGIEIPVKMESVLRDEQATQAFAERARLTVQR